MRELGRLETSLQASKLCLLKKTPQSYFGSNILASLTATLIQNYHPRTDPVTDGGEV